MELSEFTILIADDDLSLLKIYEKSLSVEGYRLILVVNDKRALAELGKTPKDLLILDHGVLTILPLIELDYPKLPVIVVSGNYEGLMKDYEKKGFANVKVFYVKPESMDVIKQKIREILKIEDFQDR